MKIVQEILNGISRAFIYVFICLGIFIYSVFTVLAYHEYLQVTVGKPWTEQLFDIVFMYVFATGTTPMLLVVYFLILGKTETDWKQGVLFVIGMTFVHLEIGVFTAHGSWTTYVPLQIIELLGVLTLIYRRHKIRCQEAQPDKMC